MAKTRGAVLALLALVAVLTLPARAQTELFQDNFDSATLSSNWNVVSDSQTIHRTQFGNVPTMRRDADGTTYAQLRVDTYNPINKTATDANKKARGTEIFTNQQWSLPASGTGGIEFEARMRAGNLPAGLVGAFFTYGSRGVYPDTYYADEVDFENLTKPATNQLWLNIFDDWRPGPYTPGPSRSTLTTVSGLNWRNWTVYKVRWFRDRTEWYVNGVLARSEPNPQTLPAVLPKDPMGVRLNMWMPDSTWTAAYDAGVAPTADPAANVSYVYDVDYLRVRSVPSPDTAPADPVPTPTPVTMPAPVVGSGNGLSAVYYDNQDFSGASVSRIDSRINFDWGAGSPNASIGVDTWSARWTGQVQAQYSETYTFHSLADDGIRVWVNGQQVIDSYQYTTTEARGSITLKAGVKYDIRVEYFDNTGDALAQLAWSSLSTSRTVIPQSQLYSATLAAVATPTFSPDGGTYYGTVNTATQSVVVSCATTGATIHYTLNGTDPTESSPVVASGATVNVSGGQTLKARAWKDNFAPSGIKSATYTLVVDAQAPTVTVSSPVENYSYATLASATGTASDAGSSGLTQVTGRLQRLSDNQFWNGTAWVTAPIASAPETAATGTTSWTWTMPVLADGKYQFRATARDRAGNATSSPVINFYKDTTAPTVAVTSPTQNGSYSGLAAASGTTTDAGPGVAQVTGRLQRLSDNQYWNGTAWTATATETDATGTDNWTWTMPASLAAGQYAFRASASDYAGNTGYSPVVSFSITLPSLAAFKVDPATVRGARSTTGTVSLAAPAGAGGTSITLSSSDASAVTMPQTVVVAAGQTSASFKITAAARQTSTSITLSASYSGTTRTATLTITPGSAWSVTDLSLPSSGDSTTRLLWQNISGEIALWTVSPSGAMQNNWNYGPYDGWTAQSIATGPDGKIRVLWSRADGQVSLWTVGVNGTIESSPGFGPYNGWTAKHLAVGADGKTRILWQNVSGQIMLWTVSAAGVMESQTAFGPYAGWSAQSIATGVDNKTRILWTEVGGQVSLWTVGVNGTIESNPGFDPYGGWTARDVAIGADNKPRLLWNNVDGSISLWTISPSGERESYANFGPYGGWTANAIAVGADNKPRVLWNNVDNSVSLWTLGVNGTIESNPGFGPY